VGAPFYPWCRRAFSPIENDRLIDGAMLWQGVKQPP
jgi:hypothetical protein